MTQSEAILSHLLKGKSLTPLDGLRSFGTLKLASRISELSASGKLPGLKKEMVEVKTRFGKTTRVMSYKLVKQKT